MVQVRERDHGEAVRAAEVAKEQRERDRIGAAGQGDEQTGSGRTQGVPLDGATDELVERGFQNRPPSRLRRFGATPAFA